MSAFFCFWILENGYGTMPESPFPAAEKRVCFTFICILFSYLQMLNLYKWKFLSH